MAYVKTNWINELVEITVARLNNLETQYDEALGEIDAEFVGLENVDNLSADAIRSGVTAEMLGLGDVDNMSAEDIRTSETMAFEVEVRTDDPASPADGRMWLRSDL